MYMEHTTSTPSVGVFNRGFVALLVTMVCGAINDNLLRGALLIGVAAQGLWEGQLGSGGTGWVTTMLYLPFILLLGLSGQLADRHPKRTIIVLTRVVEVLLTLLVTLTLWIGHLPLICVVFTLLAAQSAFFSPAKYGSVPELVSDTDLSRANGVLSLLTNVAIVLGVGAGGGLLYVSPLWLGVTMVLIACIGLASALSIPRQHQPPQINMIRKRFLAAHSQVLGKMKGTPLLVTALAWCWFYAVGSILLAIVPMLREPLNLSGTVAGALLAAPGIGIGVGGLVAGIVSGRRIRSGLILTGASGMTISLALLGFITPSIAVSLPLLIVTGIFAGCYVVPLLAMLQHMPEPTFRARTVGTANFMTYVAMSVSAIAFALAASAIGAEPSTWFLVSAGMMVLVTIWVWAQRRILAAGAAPSMFATVQGPSS